MTSYMYNPSKKVEELLSKYLEFDQEQLKLGIWSGNLSLRDVHLREETLYPLMNHYLNKPSATDGQNYVKPPLRVKLVSGTIGSLSLKIPWKRLVWGQGDVKVEMQNIVIVLALESRQETQEREKRYEKDDDDLFPQSEFGEDFKTPEGKTAVNDTGSGSNLSREKKQKRIREAERRHLQNRSLAAWLESMNKKDMQEKAKAAVNEAIPLTEEGTIEKWFKGVTSDFFWRFYAGLEMTIDNLKIVFVQDGIEVGVIAPSIQAVAGEKAKKSATAAETGRRASGVKPFDDTDSEVGSVGAAPLEYTVYEGEYDDGEHVDKSLKFTGLSVYVRKVSTPGSVAGAKADHYPVDVSTQEYILRPVDFNFSFSLFYPYPLERRKKIALQKKAAPSTTAESRTIATAATSTDNPSGGNSSSSSYKRRRGKRDKVTLIHGGESMAETELTSTHSISPHLPGHKRTGAPVTFGDDAVPKHSRRSSSKSSTAFVSDSRSRGRRQSMVGSLRQPTPQRAHPGHTRHNASVSLTPSLPLARPDDIGSVYAAATAESVDLTPRFDGRVNVGALNFLCSTRHYELFNAFLAAGARMRNGRPSKMIRSVLDQDQALRRSLTVEALNDEGSVVSFVSPGPTGVGTFKHEAQKNRKSLQLRLELPVAHNERSEVVRLWWRYVYGVVVWELRQRKKLRKNFQDKYLSFSWERQRYKRREYINLYIAVHLESHKQADMWGSSGSFSSSPDTDLLALEDELPIEQIILYRALARAIHVRGGAVMPESILGLHEGREPSKKSQHPHGSHETDETGEFGPGTRRQNVDETDENPTFLTTIAARCDVARTRRKVKDGDALCAYEHNVPWSKLGGLGLQSVDAEEASFGPGGDKTVRTFKSTKSGVSTGMKYSARVAAKASADPSMLLSFSVTMDKLEFMVVEEEFYYDGFDEAASRHGATSVGSAGDSETSDVSVLTDDQRFFENGGNGGLNVDAESLNVEPIMASTDYLLFKMPERILAHVQVSPLTASVLGRSGRSRNVNLTIGRIDVTGESGHKLLSVGIQSESAPVSEVQMMKDWKNGQGLEDSKDDQLSRDAISLSLVTQKKGTVLQCDASKIKTCFEIHTLTKLFKFSNTSALYPQQLLPKSAREDVRIYVLRQNAAVPMSALNCSIRVHGCELFMPYHSEEDKTEDDASYSYGSISANEAEKSGVVLRTDIVEIYSGAAVDSLSAEMDVLPEPDSTHGGTGASRGGATTRHLRMLHVAEITEARGTIFSHHWVIAASGVDCLTSSSSSPVEQGYDSLSLLESPLDIEIMWTSNENSVMDTNRAKREFVIEVSPVHFVLSQSRITRLSLIVPPSGDQSKQPLCTSIRDEALPPRLELLAIFLLYSVDLSIGRVRVSFTEDGTSPLPSNIFAKEVQMEESIADFLSVVLSFDLSHPHEEALASAMQICIDRLTGIGLPLEESWEATNTALLNFLEDIAEMRQMNSGGQGGSSDGSFGDGQESMPGDLIRDTLQRSVGRTVALFSQQLAEGDSNLDLVNAGVVIDMPDGLSLSLVKMFYDFHLNGSVPSFFVTNGAGVHLIRIIPPDNSVTGDDDDGLDNLSNNADVDAAPTPSLQNSAGSMQSGVGFGIYELDESCGFGKGGLPLSVLGTDIGANEDEERRERERIHDIEIGEVEILFTQQVVADAVEIITRVFTAVPKYAEADLKPQDDGRTYSAVDSSFLVVAVSVSILLASDELSPFCRLTLADAVVRTKASSSASNLHSSPDPDIHVSAQSLSLLNLTPEGEQYPRAMTVLPLARSVPFCVRYYRSATGSELQIELEGVRVLLLRQFINECLQFFTSGNYGLGLLLKNLRNANSNDSSSNAPALRYRISLFDSSIILPRCTSSSDMLAIELNEAHIFSSRPSESFVMPTESAPLEVFERYQKFRPESTQEFDFQDCLESLNDSTEHSESEGVKSGVRRTVVQLKGFSIYTSLSDGVSSRFHGIESPSFRFFYSIDGRASSGKSVYRRHIAANHWSSEEEEDEEESMINEEKALRCWREISTDLLSLEIFVDYAPYLRLLVRDPIDYFPKEIGLDVSLSQFCLLLSVWYENMKEQPAMFPYPRPDDMDSQPSKEFNMPEYGTDALRDLLKDTSGVSTESAFIFGCLSIRFSFDALGQSRDEVPGMLLTFMDAVVHVTGDDVGTMRIGAGSSGASFVDESRAVSRVIFAGKSGSVSPGEAVRSTSWADLKFGLDSSLRTLSDAKLPQVFQLSVFMIPGWSLYQLGFDNAYASLSDFAPIMKFLDFVSTYFKDPAYGNPSFQASNQAALTNNEKKPDIGIDPEASGSNVDFRLWLTRPRLSVPCDSLGGKTPGLRLVTDSGFWYRYTTIGDYATQECASCDLSLLYDDKFVSTEQSLGGDPVGRPLIEGLSFGLRIDFNTAHDHTDISLQIPYANYNACSMTSPRVCVLPTILPPPTICSPLNEPHRFLGAQVCEITAIIEVLPVTATALSRLFSSPEEDAQSEGQEVSSDNVNDLDGFDGASVVETEESGDPEPTKSFVANVGDLRIFALDPVLGPHLPVAVLSVALVSITVSSFSQLEGATEVLHGESAPEDFQVVVKGHFWADYFKLGLTRSWEPLLEPYQFLALHERSRFRGSGITLNSDSPLHLNVSGALLLILDEVIDSFDRLIRKTFQMETAPASAVSSCKSIARAAGTGSGFVLEDSLEDVRVLHEIPRLLESGDRVAFSLRNMTGQKIRFYRAKDAVDESASKPVVVAYVDHVQSTELSYDPSISLVQNMSITDVPYPGLPNSCHRLQQHRGHNPAVDVQLPGFRWLQGIMVDTFGRRFESLIPRSEELLRKTGQDWRLGNVMKLLAEIGLENGGRQVIVRSLFAVVNKTAHDICLSLHPDPTHLPGMSNDDMSVPIAITEDSDAVIEPEQLYQVPTLLLESALHEAGSHLGSLWARPLANSSMLHSFVEEDSGDSGDLKVAYSSRPIQLAKIVNESALLFEAKHGKDITSEDATSSVQVSCPVTRGEGERLAPFCYAVEVGRSPLVKARQWEEQEKKKHLELIHGPVAYTLSFHPPFEIVNLLPEKGRFELMHAVRRTVVWFADLEPGQHISVHSVGLDAPLLLLLNLGFCRTPVGEGALVHHGVDPPVGTRENLGGLKSIGKAGKAVTKQLGKTLTSMGESPDKRGHDKVFLTQHPNHLPMSRKKRADRLRTEGMTDLGMESGVPGTEKVDGKVHRIDTAIFFPEDIVSETSVVDTVGQRLRLHIENIRGGGGQRRISLFCPFWIVNTTEHALRYRQDKSKAFVSGTVLSPSKDGSIPLSGGRARAKYEIPRHPRRNSERSNLPMNEETIFSGTPGALATSPGRCELEPDQLAQLLDRNLPLAKLSKLAFMFNFHEGMMSVQKICVQLGDGTGGTRYVSDWSRGFNADSVGFSHPVGMLCKDGRSLELTAVVTLAPGFLSGYTKIVRFLPKYVVVNTLPMPVRVWQDSSTFRPPSANQTASADFVAKERKWRFRNERTRESRKVNQYEALWGRETILDERSREGIAVGTTAHESALYVTTVGSSEFVPFNLPDSRGERQLRIGLGGPWNLAASISAEIPGEHTLKITRALDLRLLRHAATRASPQYEVTLPPPGESTFTGELGLWFETEWGSDRSLIVKAVKKNSFSFNQSDIHVGDELLLIGAVPVSRMTFAEAMNMLRTRLAEVTMRRPLEPRRAARRGSLSFIPLMVFPRPNQALSDELIQDAEPLVLIFRTVEERLRRVRLKAARSNAVKSTERHEPSETGRASASPGDLSGPLASPLQPLEYFTAELKTLHHCMFLVIREADNIPYRVQNRTINSTIYYRQKGCSAHPWQILKPGQSDSYCWEEPMRPKRLTVRAAIESAFVDYSSERVDLADKVLEDIKSMTGNCTERERSVARQTKSLLFRRVKDEEDAVFSPSVNVRLEEIGLREFLRHPGTGQGDYAKYLELEVDVSGSTRQLVVSDVSGEGDEEQMVRYLSFLEKKCAEEELRKKELRTVKAFIGQVNLALHGTASNESAEAMLDDAQRIMEDFPNETTISAQHQIAVEVLEAVGLSSENITGLCNPFTEVYLKTGSGARTSLFKKRDVRRTYFVRKTANPTWNSQSFVFDVPPEACYVPRGRSVQVRVRNYSVVGGHSLLGSATVDFHSLRNQQPLVGWFPLSSRGGGRDLDSPLSHWGRGSIKLKIQLIYTVPALLDYFLLLSETRLTNLQESLEGMAQQLETKKEADKKKRERIDGFKAVRINDLVSLPKQVLQVHGAKKHPDLKAGRDRQLKPSEKHTRGEGGILSLDEEGKPNTKEKDSKVPASKSTGNYAVRRIRTLSRQKLKLSRARGLDAATDKTETGINSGGTGALAGTTDSAVVEQDTPKVALSLSTASIAARMLRTARKTLETKANREIEASTPTYNRKIPEEDVFRSNSERLVNEKLRVPLAAPESMSIAAKKYAATFVNSRNIFERASRRTLQAVLNPGGWLTIRPITVLNLPDTYTGMFVKLRYGSEVLVSETVDAKVNPTWQKPDEIREERTQRISELRVGPRDGNQGDLHIHVAPQKTSGSIQLSVIGERSSKRLLTKSELGVLSLPLGATIAACIDSIEESRDPSLANPATPMYVRWFPLLSPKDAVPVEGDRGLRLRPPESEKKSDDQFHEYFAPCIQLSISWWPDVEAGGPSNEESDESYIPHGGRTGQSTDRQSATQPGASASPMVKNYFNADIGRVSAALIDSQRAIELLSFSALDVDVRYWVTKAKTRIGVSIGWLQLDHQDDNPREPVIIAPTPTIQQYFPVIQVLAVKDNLRSETDVLSFHFIDISVAEFDITIEESFLFDLFDFLSSVKLRRRRKTRTSNPKGENHRDGSNMSGFSEMHDPAEPGLFSLLMGENGPGRESKVYIEQLFLGVVKVNLSYLKGKKQTWDYTNQGSWGEKGFDDVRNLPHTAFSLGEKIINYTTHHHDKSDIFNSWCQQTYDEDRWAEYGKESQNISGLIASLFPTVSDAPIRLQGKALNHVFESPSEIFQSIKKYYVNETLKQIYKIIGSLDFVGNPTMLFTSFVSGVRDLFVVPSVAFLASPTDASRVGLSVVQGALSLLSHSTSGFFGFATKVSAAAGQAVAILSLDADFRIWHQDKVVTEATNLNRVWKKRGVQSVGAMITRPFGDIVIGVTTGVSGVFMSPYKGYQRSGKCGFLRGVAIGTVGIVAKPTVGFLDALVHFSASVHDIAKSANVLDKRYQPAVKLRLPYTFGIMNILAPFDASAARAVFLLKLFPIKKRRRASSRGSTETLVHVEVLPNAGIDTYAIATTHRVVLIKLKKEASGALTPSFCWEVGLGGDAVISSRVSDHGHNGVALTITITKRADNEESVNVLQVPTYDASKEGEQEIEISPDELHLPAVGFNHLDEQYDHGVSRGQEGELLEWFTILAEYQYRRQLARLSNAISCLVGDFDAIIYDPSLGHPGSTEGFTLFGMFHFAPKGQEEEAEAKQSALSVLLEYLPWADLSAARNVVDELSEDEKGCPEWLIEARAAAVSVNRPFPSRPLQGIPEEDDSEELTTPLNTIKSAGSSRKPQRISSFRHSAESQMGVHAAEDADSDVPEDGERSVDGVSQDGSSVVTSPETETEFPPRPASSNGSKSVFYSAKVWVPPGLENTTSTPRLSTLPDRAPKAQRSTSDSALHSSPQRSSLKVKKMLGLFKPDLIVAQQKEKESALSKQQGESRRLSLTSENEIRREGNEHAASKLSEDRLERMERLIERMLILTSEQAIQNMPSALAGIASIADSNETQVLRQEIDDLRDQLRDQSSRAEKESAELSALRREITEWKKQITTGANDNYAGEQVSPPANGGDDQSDQDSAPCWEDAYADRID